MNKREHIEYMAKRYNLNAGELEKRLNGLRERHDYLEHIYDEKMLNKKAHRESCTSVETNARNLVKQLNDAPQLKTYIDTCEELPDANDLLTTLEQLQDAMKAAGQKRGAGTPQQRKKDFHRNSVIYGIVRAYPELKGMELEDFMHDACNYMDIDPGLYRKYEALKAQDNI